MTEYLSCDLCVIGAGAAGLSIAAGAARLGRRVVLIEKGKMGGDCLNTGCIPSKTLLANAKSVYTCQKTKICGVLPLKPVINGTAIHKNIQETIALIAPHDSQKRFEDMGVTVIREEAHFISAKKLKTGTYTITAKNFVIATGSRPSFPAINGLVPDKALTNETIFDLKSRPEHLIIIGGGPIGIEMAQAHERLGSQVTVIDIGTILPKDDPELVSKLRTTLESEGIHIYENTKISKIEQNKNYVSVKIRQGKNSDIIKGSHLLVATGRAPCLEKLDLDKAGVKYNTKGIIVDRHLRTSKHHIFAAGDVTGGPQFTHIAGYHAGIIIRNLLFKMSAKTDYKALPWVTYTDPELAQVGLTETMAREKYGSKIKTINRDFSENDRARTEKQYTGQIKIILTKKGKILGVSILSPHAGEIAGLWCLAISQKMKIGTVANMIMPYPTYGEISKHVAGDFYTQTLFSDKTRKLVKILGKLPF